VIVILTNYWNCESNN